MGGHGGLNILPQKRWNVYNFDNREKVRKDEEEAAKEEQLKREQSRKRDTEFRIEQLRQARGFASSSRQGTVSKAAESPEPKEKDTETKSTKHINLFEGIRIFDPVDDKKNNNKRESLAGSGGTSDNKNKRAKEEPKVVSAEDEKYRLGYGIAGKGVKLPWYLMEKQQHAAHHNDSSSDTTPVTGSSKNKKKSVAELREERLKREAREKARQQALLLKHPHRTRYFRRGQA
uniref:leukocyte receptor cluster member 1 homolog isoform X2 n=1 Tax=Erigeron canadensis TaxID=72917 RepID=UPI001CB9CABF|nr:leukocyte receptor cluster member 1 homolog isoform X2 [Erigeron canadensis]